MLVTCTGGSLAIGHGRFDLDGGYHLRAAVDRLVVRLRVSYLSGDGNPQFVGDRCVEIDVLLVGPQRQQ